MGLQCLRGLWQAVHTGGLGGLWWGAGCCLHMEHGVAAQQSGPEGQRASHLSISRGKRNEGKPALLQREPTFPRQHGEHPMGRGPGRRGSGTAMGWRVWIPTSPRCGLVPGNGSQVEAVPCIPMGMEAVMATKASRLCWPEPSVLHAVMEGLDALLEDSLELLALPWGCSALCSSAQGSLSPTERSGCCSAHLGAVLSPLPRAALGQR